MIPRNADGTLAAPTTVIRDAHRAGLRCTAGRSVGRTSSCRPSSAAVRTRTPSVTSPVRSGCSSGSGHRRGVQRQPRRRRGRGRYTTYALDKADGKPDYVTDSAASGSGWATGTKTYNGAISVDIAGAPQRTLIEIARANGLRTGDVSTAELQDATPAVQIAHVTDRGCYAPTVDDDEVPRPAPCRTAASARSPSSSSATAPTSPSAAAPRPSTSPPSPGRGPGRTLLQQATDRGYQVVTDAACGLGGDHPGEPVLARARPLRARQHGGTALGRPARHAHRRHRARRRRARPTPPDVGHLADARRDDDQGDRPAQGRRQEGLLPPGRGRQHRQAGPRREPLRADRRDRRPRRGRAGRAHLREGRTATRSSS